MVSAVSFTPRISNGAFISRMQTLITGISKAKATDLWKLIDPENVGSITLGDLHKMFASRYGKDRKSAGEGQGIIQRVITRIMQRCGDMAGIRGLQRTLMIMDDSGDKKLSKDELRYGLRDYGVEMNIRETDEIFAYFDRNRDGTISITEFLVGVRGDLNARRKKCIRMAFDVLDSDGSGEVTVEEIADVYDVSQNPEVISGKRTTKEALIEFMGQWEDGEKDGVVTYEEFENYYKEISASIDGDDYFELMIRNAWRIAGGSGNASNTANLRVLVTDKDGNERVQTVEKELGLKAGDRDEIRKRLMAQGVDATNIELYGGMDATEKPRVQRGGAPQPAQRGGAQPRGGGALQQPRQLETKNGVDVGNPRSAFQRNVAALKLAAAFRGRVGRKIALQQKRKVDAANRKKAEEAAEAAIPRAKNLIRPFPKKKSN
jgi:Ca2+-binding EF-hand superfamily protein